MSDYATDLAKSLDGRWGDPDYETRINQMAAIIRAHEGARVKELKEIIRRLVDGVDGYWLQNDGLEVMAQARRALEGE